MKLKDKVAFVTGGSSGIGEAVAKRFAREGAKVIVAASSDLAKAENVVASIRENSGTAIACVVDVRKRESVDAAVATAEKAFGAIDVLVNGAGVYYATPIGATSVEDMNRMIDVNLKGTFNMINAVAPSMKAAGRGRIVNFSSVAAVMGVRERSLYCATKAAIAQMTAAMARELAPFGVAINAIAPGNTSTPMNVKVRTDPAYAAQLTGMKAATPSPTTYSDPEDIATIVLFLASDDARTMHGALVIADEGISTGLG
ncbi:MAG: SDR family NAD(P)-dependent oxidoreductase [Steroidobacteraceae bacterium]